MSALPVCQIFPMCPLQNQNCSANNRLIVRSSVILTVWWEIGFKARFLKSMPRSHEVQTTCMSTTTSRCTVTEQHGCKITGSEMHIQPFQRSVLSRLLPQYGFTAAFLSRTPQPWITHRRPRTALLWINPISYSRWNRVAVWEHDTFSIRRKMSDH